MMSELTPDHCEEKKVLVVDMNIVWYLTRVFTGSSGANHIQAYKPIEVRWTVTSCPVYYVQIHLHENRRRALCRT